MISFPDGTLRREQDLCRERLEQARLRYEAGRTPEHRAEYLRLLTTFASLISNVSPLEFER